MKKLLLPIAAICLLVFISCDKVENPIPIDYDDGLDWDLFPDGDSVDYSWPEWIANTNTNRNVLIEDFTGHLCTNCPAAAAIASSLETNNPGRVFVASIHASPDGSFQEVQPPEFISDFTTDAGNNYTTDMPGFLGNPMGTINRLDGGFSGVWYFDSDWGLATSNALTAPLQINLQLQHNYFASTNAIFVHTETEFATDLDGIYNVVLYLIRDTVIASQKLNTGATEEEYHHHSVLTDNINGTWGTQMVSGTVAAGEKFYNDFSYQIPTTDSTFTIDNLSVISYVCNRETYEILQVIKTKL